jgi:hypothetical protein
VQGIEMPKYVTQAAYDDWIAELMRDGDTLERATELLSDLVIVSANDPRLDEGADLGPDVVA